VRQQRILEGDLLSLAGGGTQLPGEHMRLAANIFARSREPRSRHWTFVRSARRRESRGGGTRRVRSPELAQRRTDHEREENDLLCRG